MVLINLKQGEECLFLFECPSVSKVSELHACLTTLHNDRLRLITLVNAVPDLLKYGPMKQSHSKIVDEVTNGVDGQEIIRNGFVFQRAACPNNEREGFKAGDAVVELFEGVFKDTSYLEYTKSGKCLSQAQIDHQFSRISEVLSTVFPQGLPKCEPVSQAMNDKYSEKLEYGLWWAGKELSNDKCLSDYVGQNDKTKILVKLQKRGSGPPTREIQMDEQERKNLMAYYYSKQEELKKLEENEDDEYLNSSWANPQALKNSFTGIQNIKYGLR